MSPRTRRTLLGGIRVGYRPRSCMCSVTAVETLTGPPPPDYRLSSRRGVPLCPPPGPPSPSKETGARASSYAAPLPDERPSNHLIEMSITSICTNYVGKIRLLSEATDRVGPNTTSLLRPNQRRSPPDLLATILHLS